SGTVFGLKAIGDDLWFLGSDPTHGLEPWAYNPGNMTARMIADILPGTGGSFAGEFTLLGGTVFFSARDTSPGSYHLWGYDLNTTNLWKADQGSQPTELTAVNGHLLFATPNELRMFNTTSNSSYDIDINPGILGSSPSSLALMGNTLYLSANDGNGGGTELQVYEMSNNSTWAAADIRPGFATSAPSDLTVLGTRVYMQATSGSHFEMWVYDSQNHSFWEVTNFQSTSGFGGPKGFTAHKYSVYFTADDGTGVELWAHNSVNGTTWQVIDLKPVGGNVGEIAVHNGNVVFAGEDNLAGQELWRLLFSQTVTFV
ncbi:MAG: hypothetical protein L7U48_05415, partial [Candidatus Poseidoniaceae archaeon]|nr:hypothetical protein [Candidatus Poseidoniaceae archaeon]